ncbi:MAG: dephospho-CoA kinase [Treponema sp.]|jgi:dephospho-CoA kinase|nr:dephospho-CoA kinase [Treponema sp.]
MSIPVDKPGDLLIGLTGLYCAGKNHVAALLEKRGLPILDVDRLGHEAIRTERDAIIRRFGGDILDGEGQIDRRLLGRRVFGRDEELAALEAIVHPAANALTGEWIARQRGPCVINAALLHRSPVLARLDGIMVVRAPLPVRFFRAWKRDSLPPKELIKRFFSQKDFPFMQIRRAQLFFGASDIYTIENPGFPGSQRNLENQIDVILEGLCHGKEKITACSCFGGSIPGNRGGRCDPCV